MKLIIDVRTREEFVKEHVKGAINIPLHDIPFYLSFLSNKEIEEIKLYCNTGRRAELARKILEEHGIKADVIKPKEIEKYEKEGRKIICAINYVYVRNGMEKDFEESVEKLCKATDEMPGFLGGKLFKISGISAIGSGLPGNLKNEEIKPVKYIMLTYWESKELHDKSHETEIFKDAFSKLPVFLTRMPYEEFYEVMR